MTSQKKIYNQNIIWYLVSIMNIKEILKDNKKSLTPERIQIFEYGKTHHLFSAQDISWAFPLLWRASVFRTLNLFIELGIIRRLHLWERWDFYEINDENHHHEHMKCEKCGCILSFHSQNICAAIFEEAKKLGFTIKEHHIWVFWLCNKCQ